MGPTGTEDDLCAPAEGRLRGVSHSSDSNYLLVLHPSLRRAAMLVTVMAALLFSFFFDFGEIQNMRETQEHCWFYLIE